MLREQCLASMGASGARRSVRAGGAARGAEETLLAGRARGRAGQGRGRAGVGPGPGPGPEGGPAGERQAVNGSCAVEGRTRGCGAWAAAAAASQPAPALTHLAEPDRAPCPAGRWPPRTLRARSWGVPAARGGGTGACAACVAEADTVEVLRHGSPPRAADRRRLSSCRPAARVCARRATLASRCRSPRPPRSQRGPPPLPPPPPPLLPSGWTILWARGRNGAARRRRWSWRSWCRRGWRGGWR